MALQRVRRFCTVTRSAAHPPILHGPTLTERRSKFQAHVAPVHSPEQVAAVRSVLLADKRLARATHPVIAAWRLAGEHGVQSGGDDDGEHGASQRMLRLLQHMQVQNTVVFCSRWFGGTQLGSSRFRLIGQAVKDALRQYDDELGLEREGDAGQDLDLDAQLKDRRGRKRKKKNS